MLQSVERVCAGVYLLKQSADVVSATPVGDLDFDSTARRPAEVIGANHIKGKIGVDEKIRRAAIVRTEDAKLLYAHLRKELNNIVSHFVIKHLNLPSLDYEGDQIVIYGPNDHFAPHRDSGLNFPNRYLSVVRCLRMNCIGGELEFIKEGVRIRQKPGEFVVFFPELVHASLPIISGEKAVFVSWMIGPI